MSAPCSRQRPGASECLDGFVRLSGPTKSARTTREHQLCQRGVQSAIQLDCNGWRRSLALISGGLLPLILAGGLELMYLAIVPQNYRFQRLVRSWKFAERQKQKQQRLGEM